MNKHVAASSSFILTMWYWIGLVFTRIVNNNITQIFTSTRARQFITVWNFSWIVLLNEFPLKNTIFISEISTLLLVWQQ